MNNRNILAHIQKAVKEISFEINLVWFPLLFIWPNRILYK